ncbi:WS/DGAT/MGAT family O-acyltransferase [Nocardioides ferulae]|uniref:WS/DGAT/MGAT family O-acyltransferase n=1 Tax=Nocardioides ferulae TaxID=2340821 RepID=UPI000EACE2A0|nr:wax ester/triacylglycerol synthase family O-acyltransferase [Nocardioides ferulae]
MVTPIDPTSAAFLLAENRRMPMHVAALQLFETPDGAGRDYPRRMFEAMSDVPRVAPLFRKHPRRSLALAGQLAWHYDDDAEFDLGHHVRHAALPRPGRIRELLDLTSRVHGTRLAWDRPLWESYVIEGLRDGRVAMYTKTHHALVDGISAMRLMQSVLTTDPAQRGMPAPWAERPGTSRSRAERSLADVPASALRTALGLSAEAAGMPAALVRTLNKGLRNETSAISLYAPRTMFNQTISGARRFAAQDWPIARLRAVGKSSGTTINDVVLAMCSGAVRRYLIELDALPETTLVAMVPVGLNARDSHLASADGGNAVGSVMCRLGTDLEDAADRLMGIHGSMRDGKQALASMTPAQIVAMSALGQAPAILAPLLRMQGLVRPPYNLIISNVPGPRTTHYWNGAKLVGSYPVSIPINGMALNITCTSYDTQMAFGLTGCRRTVPHLQRLLTHLDDELAALEQATGVS